MKAGLLIFAMAESLSTRLRFLQSVVAPSTAAIGNDGGTTPARHLAQ